MSNNNIKIFLIFIGLIVGFNNFASQTMGRMIQGNKEKPIGKLSLKELREKGETEKYQLRLGWGSLAAGLILASGRSSTRSSSVLPFLWKKPRLGSIRGAAAATAAGIGVWGTFYNWYQLRKTQKAMDEKIKNQWW
jgi:hypothetical protein